MRCAAASSAGARVAPPGTAPVTQHTSCGGPGAPRCTACRHASAERPRHCLHPQQPIDVDGLQPIALCMVVRGDLDQCRRDGLAFCGPSGWLFEPRRPSAA